jgi:hypothetical protein
MLIDSKSTYVPNFSYIFVHDFFPLALQAFKKLITVATGVSKKLLDISI